MNSTLLVRLNAWLRVVLVLLVLGAAQSARAAHLLGGEMTYRYLDANGPAIAPLRYELTVTLYNNCGNNVTTLRPSASIGIYDQATNARVALTLDNYDNTVTYAGQDGMMSILQTSVSACLSPAVPPGCTITGPSLPYRVQKFVGVVNLRRSAKGYYALFTDGNRNNDVTNLYQPGTQALTLYAALQPPQLPNHSPVFSDVAVAVICAGDTTILLNNAVDADGDRLAYTFGQPYGIVGALGALPLGGFALPVPVLAYAPGYGYSAATPFGTAAGNFAALDPATGIAKYLASTPGGKYVVAVDVNEYRTINGQEILVGTTRRDLQLVVAQCPATKAPVLPPPAVMSRNYTIEAGSSLRIPITVTQADGHPLTLTLNSQLLDGPGGYAATLNGDPGTVAPGNPTGTATITGTNGTVTGTFALATTCADARPTPYDVALTAKDTGCAGKTVVEVLHITVTKPAGPTISGPAVVCDLGMPYGYEARGSAARVSWRVVGGTLLGSPTATTVQVQWGSAGGTLTVRGTAQYGCPTDSATQRVVVGQPVALAVAGTLSICRGSSATLTASGGVTYTVVGGPATLTGPGPFVVSPTQTTTYTITALATSTACATTSQVTVAVLPGPAAAAGPSGLITCSGVPIGLGAAPVAGSTYSWSPATGLSSATAANPTATLTNLTGAPITQTYTLTETSATGSCQASHSVTVTVSPAIVAAAGPITAICSGEVGQLGAAPVAGFVYSWSPATGLSSSTIANPTVALPNATGVPATQTYTLTATNTRTGCVGVGSVTVTVSPPPVVVPGLPIVICSGEVGQLGAAPVAGFVYSWSPATGLSSSTIANPTVALTNTTAAAVVQAYTLTTTNLANCSASASVTVRINPLPVAAAGPAIATCAGIAVQLGAAPVAGYTYSWSPAIGLSSSTIANPTVTLPNATGAPITQGYTLLVRNPATACANTATVAVTVNPALGAGTIGPDQALCPGTSAAPLTSVAAARGGTGTYTYQWETSPDNLSWADLAGATGPTYAPGVVATTTYYRRRATSGNCTAATSNAVALRLQPVLPVGVALATPATQCAGLPFVFTPVPTNAGAAPTYRWLVNNILVANGPTYTVTTLRNGDQVRVELTPTAGICTTGAATATVTISLTPAPLPTLAISVQTGLPVCPGTPVVFQVDKVTDSGANPLYQWQVDGAAVPGAQGTTFSTTTLRNGQAVTLALRTTNACGPITLISNALPVSILEGLEVKAGPDKTVMEGDHVTLEGTASGSYPVTWTPAASLSFEGTSRLRPIASPLVTTTYTLSTGSGYCAISSTVTVTVTPRLRIPNALSPNGDGLDDTWQIDHIGDYAANKVTVLNRWGNKIFETSGYRRGNEWDGTISGQPAPVGTYYYLITLGNGKAYTGSLTVVY
ncbi:gliding motility-associated C-terminal domain-containing protein [Hymenobacter sp. H14-R3]|uniref:T9SS type B sorting domain-containing protein n=1 Tax=Hymenobacter sp. H14-R3 TaxID=3046308 RepID=UPI0024B9FBCF|nr:gliding motility-associated C-terminal domain-containing protein [Hymenobacter sp. H14-R3]MDJ0364232.1 gliding motility-associated C-terminal domain-containing protein [Hymenobacter sp. H14-R3]